ncbi:unnamed protein product, partial [Ectocarpus sp. 4 AP-2014]
ASSRGSAIASVRCSGRTYERAWCASRAPSRCRFLGGAGGQQLHNNHVRGHLQQHWRPRRGCDSNRKPPT